MHGFGCRTVDGMAFCEAGGLPFSAEWRAGAEAGLLFRFAAEESARPLAARLKKEKQPYVRWFSRKGADGHSLFAQYRPPSDVYAKAGIQILLRRMTALGQEGALAPPEACPLCGQPGADAFACLSNAYRPVHAACVQTRLELPEADRVVEAAAGGRVLPGLLGALLGAALGVLPILTLALKDGAIHWMLYAFIPVFSGLLYRLLRGRARLAASGLSVLLASLLAAFALELIWFWLLLSAAYDRPVSFFISAQSYFATHTPALAVREMFVCLLALLAGFLAATVFLRRYVREGLVPRHTVRGAAFVRKTLSPRRDDIHQNQP